MTETTAGQERSPRATTSPIDFFVENGYHVFESRMGKEKLAVLRREYMDLLNRKIDRFGLRPVPPDPKLVQGSDAVLNEFKPNGGNHDLNRWNMHLPSTGPLFDEALFNDPRVMEIVDALIGPEAVCYLMASDTPLPGSGYQGAHQDFTRFSIVVNIPLCDVTHENGPTELWPWTHRGDTFSTERYFIPAEKARAIASSQQPLRMRVPAGSLVLRDHRLLHRGTANLSAEARPMLSFYYVLPDERPYSWLASAGVKAAERVRRVGRGAEGRVANERLLNLGNLLGRIVEESAQSDRDYRRPIDRETYRSLSPRAQRLLRYAFVSDGADTRPLSPGNLVGSARMVRQCLRACASFAAHQLRHTPRRPD
jgi:ectoine hydroxylase-related dioxygenase (phytanoyl-CoA dioxygenase family)